MTNLFATANSNAVAGNNRGLSGTAQLTATASELANFIINAMNNNIDEYADAIRASQTDNNAMDNLLEGFESYKEADVQFLADLDEKTIEGMLKSQQSKRSRCKSKAMTLDNYKALMTGAIAENLIRRATGKEKHAGGSRRMSGSVDYTIEQLQALSEDQEALRREIRNVQSKKSIMKSKADFDETSERWQQLLKAEQQLKDMRISTGNVVEVDTTKIAVAEMLEDIDIEHMKANDAKELLAKISQMVNDSEVEAE